MLKELDMETALKLQACLHKYGHNFVTMRKAVKLLGISHTETIIPRRFFKLCFAVRKAMLNPQDKGGYGKCKEAEIRLFEDKHVTRVLWREFFAHSEELDDIRQGKVRCALEVKTGAGDWMKSACFEELDDILAEYKEHKELIRWDVNTSYYNPNNEEDARNGATVRFNILCTWEQLFDYLNSYTGRGQWFRKPVPTEQGQYLVRMQEFRTSWPKCQYLMNCPYRQDR